MAEQSSPDIQLKFMFCCILTINCCTGLISKSLHVLLTKLIPRRMAVDQNITAFNQAIMENDTSATANDHDYRAVDGLCRQQIFAYMVYDTLCQQHW